MKTIFRFLLLVFSVFANMNPLLAQWVQTAGPGYPPYSTCSNGNDLYAGSYGYVFLSTNAGDSWNVTGPGIPSGGSVWSLVADDSGMFAGTRLGVFRTTNRGTTWQPRIDGFNDRNVACMTFMGTDLFAGTQTAFGGTGGKVYRSTDWGTHWSGVGDGVPYLSVLATVVAGNRLFVGTWGKGVFLSTNRGAQWSEVNNGLPNISGIVNAYVMSFAVKGNTLFVGLYATSVYAGGVYRSTDFGDNWVRANNGLTDTAVTVLGAVGATLLVGTQSAGIFMSTNDGQQWFPANQGLPNPTGVYALSFSNNFAYIGIGQFVWRRPLSEITSVKERSQLDVPESITLEQNYPNPFNPSTTIQFSLPSSEFVSLKLFNVLGEEITDLSLGRMSAGTHTATWNGSNASSGIYYYQLRTGNMVQTRKLILLR